MRVTRPAASRTYCVSPPLASRASTMFPAASYVNICRPVGCEGAPAASAAAMASTEEDTPCGMPVPAVPATPAPAAPAPIGVSEVPCEEEIGFLGAPSCWPISVTRPRTSTLQNADEKRPSPVPATDSTPSRRSIDRWEITPVASVIWVISPA